MDMLNDGKVMDFQEDVLDFAEPMWVIDLIKEPRDG